MKKHSMPEMKESGVNVTPLIDVVMCLIIFFMLVAKIGVSTGATPMELPQTIMGKKIDALGDNIIINVQDPTLDRDEKGLPRRDEAGKLIHIASARTALNHPKVTAALDEQQRLNPPEIALSNERGQHPLRDALKAIYESRKKEGREKDFSVTLRAEKDLPFSMLQIVLAEIAQAGVRNVNYGSKEKVVEVAQPAAE